MLYKHDCDTCNYLGSYNGHDLYFHNKPPFTVVARFGDSGSDYRSGIAAIRYDGELREAWCRSSEIIVSLMQDIEFDIS